LLAYAEIAREQIVPPPTHSKKQDERFHGSYRFCKSMEAFVKNNSGQEDREVIQIALGGKGKLEI
jgi:hypothetical protein